MIPNQALIEICSIAIWNRKKIIMAIAATLWLTNVVVSTRGKSFPFSSSRILGNAIQTRCFLRYRAGEYAVPASANLLDSFIRSSDPAGTPLRNNA